MGSARVMNSKPAMEKPDKKSMKDKIKSLLHIKDKPKTRETRVKARDDVKSEETVQKKETRTPQNVNALASILENFQRLDIRATNKEAQENEDESQNFTVKVINDSKPQRNNSQSSEDSGFLETKEAENFDKSVDLDKVSVNYEQKTDSQVIVIKLNAPEKCDKVEKVNKTENVDKTEEVIGGLEKLELDDDKKRKPKKLQTITVVRSPMRPKVCNYSASSYPYPAQDSDRYSQIHQINKQTLTGGQVIVNQQLQDNLTEVDIALQHVENQSQVYRSDPDCYLNDLLEYINEDTKTFAQVPQQPEIPDQDAFLNNLLKETLSSPDNFAEKEINNILFSVNDEYNVPNDVSSRDYIYPTPPPNDNDNVLSPIASPSFSNYEYLSPELSPVYNSDHEVYQEIPHFDEAKEKRRDRANSTSLMTMKQFKDMQKDILYNMSKKECCQLSRKSCKEIFQEHLQKLKVIERKNLCFKVAKLELKNAFGVLHHILLSFSRGCEQEDLHYALFGLVCGRILTEDPSLFTGDAGLSVLKSAALRCPHRALFTRYLVQCVRAALRADPALARDKHAVFHETDILGDHLLLACARAGDRCADVLAELARAEPGQPPLFKTHHTNADGYTALHVACSQHSAAAPRLHTVHVLLDHASADIWKGDIKGGDSALHLAVNSATCDLQLIMLMFKHVDRKMWKNLAHCQNMSSVTPIEYARSATKSTTRQNYPQEVLDFLKKCR